MGTRVWCAGCAQCVHNRQSMLVWFVLTTLPPIIPARPPVSLCICVYVHVQNKFSESREALKSITPANVGKEIMVPMTASLYVKVRVSVLACQCSGIALWIPWKVIFSVWHMTCPNPDILPLPLSGSSRTHFSFHC